MLGSDVKPESNGVILGSKSQSDAHERLLQALNECLLVAEQRMARLDVSLALVDALDSYLDKQDAAVPMEIAGDAMTLSLTSPLSPLPPFSVSIRCCVCTSAHVAFEAVTRNIPLSMCGMMQLKMWCSHLCSRLSVCPRIGACVCLQIMPQIMSQGCHYRQHKGEAHLIVFCRC